MAKDLMIWVSYHKDELVAKHNLKNDEHHTLFPTHRDAELENINVLNPVLSEMVTMWYVWRNNLRSDLVGFEHYRRHLDIRELPKRGQCVIYTRAHFTETIYHQYGQSHGYHDIEDMLCVLEDAYGEGNPYIQHILEDNTLLANCTFLMAWEDFIRLASFLFHSLHVFCHRHIYGYERADNDEKLAMWRLRTIGLYNINVEYQTRCLSFLAERLISAWIKTNLKVIN